MQTPFHQGPPNTVLAYCQMRCIALGVLQTPEGFWIFLFPQSSEWGRGYANHNTTRSQTASPACDSYETGERNLRTDTT